MREGKNGKRSNSGDPQSSHDERVPASIFITMHARARTSSPLALVFLIWVVYSLWWARLLVLVLYGIYKAHDDRMKSAVSAERAYWTDGRRCFMSVFDERGRLS